MPMLFFLPFIVMAGMFQVAAEGFSYKPAEREPRRER